MNSGTLLQARRSYARRAWGEAYATYATAAVEAALELDDLECHAIVAHLIGRNDESRDLLAQGYREALRTGERTRAVRFAFWVGHGLIFDGGMSEASGWFTRARQLLADLDPECAEHGYLLIPQGVEQLMAGTSDAASATFAEAQEIAMRSSDLNLLAIAGHGRGRALIPLGHIAEGMAVLDEVTVAVTSGEVSPTAVGNVYCGVLEACREVLDLRRAREWTGAMSGWCEGQGDLVPYRGPCQVHRAELLQFHGSWSDAFEEAQRACAWLSLPASPEVRWMPSTGSGSSTAYVGHMPRPRKPTGRQAGWAGDRSRGSLCSGWPGASSALRKAPGG